jgi:hypothetical protein
MFRNMKKVSDMPKAVASFMWLIAMPVILESLMKGQVPEDEDEWAEWFFLQSLLYGTTSVPFVRDVANGALTEYGYSFTPAEGILESSIRAGKKAAEGDFDDVFWRNTAKAGGALLHLPTGQATKTIEFFLDGKSDEPVREFIMGPKR